MSTHTPAATMPATPAGECSARGYRLTALGVLRSEWTKFWSLRSAWLTLACAAAGTLALGLIAAGAFQPGDGGDEELDPVSLPLFGLNVTALAVAVLGVMALTGEYTTGMIRASMTAVPRRLPVLWAKTAVLTAAVLAVFLPVGFLTFLAAQPLLAGTGIESSLSDPGIARAITGKVVFTAYSALLGLTIGALLRRTAGAIAVYVGALMMLPEFATLLPWDWVDDVTRYLPFDVGESLGRAHPADGALATPVAYALMAAWSVAGLAAAALLLKRRDV